MRSVSEHRSVVAGLIGPTDPIVLPLAAARGRALAGDVRAAIALPGFDNSAMDGYAVRSADVATASADQPVTLPVPEDIPAGRTDRPRLTPGTAHRIMTGAPVPEGADAIVPVENTDGGTASVAITAPAPVGRHIRCAGEDVTPGESVLPAGRRLGSTQLGLLSALGCVDVEVRRPALVAVLSTGSELIRPGTELAHGQIYESNAVMLAAAVGEAGAQARTIAFVSDEPDRFLAALDAVIDAPDGPVDLVITSGGVSAGAYEVVKDSLGRHGVEFTKVAMQPGMPQGAGRYRDIPFVTLPGNPVSASVSFEVFVRPTLRAAMGFADSERPRRRARLLDPLRSPNGKRQFRRGLYDPAEGTVRTMGPPASHHLRWLAASNCLLEVPEDVTEQEEGSEVEIWDLGE